MKRIVLGTAGHIDHGKTTLVKALTGIDCDRLKEEKERGITTELGFAHYRLGDDLTVGIVDVPGHEKFVRHMVAGVWGIDMVLFVIAADEGVMPQTREHMDICEILGVKRGIIVITKKDIVDDDMAELVYEDVKEFVAGRALDSAPVVMVSATTGDNLEVLKKMIIDMAAQISERSQEGIFRLPVDRVFTIKGLGTIVTGTCISGAVRVGEEVELYPLGKRSKVKNIQTYHEDAEMAFAGQRVAINLQGVERNEIGRGVTIGKPGSLFFTQRIDASLKYLKLPAKPIKHDSVLRFHIATTQEEARMVILSKDTISPGEELFVQFVFHNPLVALPGDRFILRGPYEVQTIGGGYIIDIAPPKHKRKTPEVNDIYDVLTVGDDLAKAEYHVEKGKHSGVDRDSLAVLLGKDERKNREIVVDLEKKGRVKIIGRMIINKKRFDAYKESLVSVVKEFAEKNPLKFGISREELRTRLPSVNPSVFQEALDECLKSGNVEAEKDKVKIALSGKSVNTDFSEKEMRIVKVLADSGLTPPGFTELITLVSVKDKDLRDILNRLSFEGKVVKVKGDMYFHHDAIDKFKEKVVSLLSNHSGMTPSDFKSIADLSRKYMIPLLEYLDEIKLTIRVGDKRVLRR